MDGTKIADLVRTLFGVLSGYLMAKGIGDADLWTAVASGAALVVAAVWTFWSKPKAE